MKKMTPRDQMLLFGMIVLVILYLFYTYVFSPFEEKLGTLRGERDTLQTEVDIKNPGLLEKQLERTNANLALHKSELKQYELERMITQEEQEKLLLYIGEKANELGVSLIKFEEQSEPSDGAYKVKGFDVKARGDSKDLVLFMNSIYTYYNYCFITDVNLRKVEIIPTFESLDVGALTDEEKERVSWSDDQLDLIMMEIPPYIIKEEESESGKEIAKKSYNKELQIDFSIYFILSD